MCFSCICLFVLYALDFVIFLFLLVSGLFVIVACTFLLTFLAGNRDRGDKKHHRGYNILISVCDHRF